MPKLRTNSVGRGVEAAVQVDLLVGRRAVAAVARRAARGGGFHAAEDLPGELAAAGRVERERRAGRRRSRRSGRRRTSARSSRDVRAPSPFSSATCSGLRTMLTRPMPSARQMRSSIWPRFDAAAVWTSALWPSLAHRLDHAERGQRIDERRRAVRGGRAGGQRQALRHGTQRYCAYIPPPPSTATVLPSRACAVGRRAGRDDRAGAFVAGRHRLVERAAIDFIAAARDRRGQTGARVPDLRRVHVGGAEDEADVRRVDRRRLDADQHLVFARRRRRRLRATGRACRPPSQRSKLQSGLRDCFGHVVVSVVESSFDCRRIAGRPASVARRPSPSHRGLAAIRVRRRAVRRPRSGSVTVVASGTSSASRRRPP